MKIIMTWIIVAMMFVLQGLQAQDVHFTQYFNTPMLINPGLTGIHNALGRVAVSYRNQWTTVPVPYTTFAATYDRKIYPRYKEDHFYGIGARLLYDYAGDSHLSILDLNVLGNYAFVLNPRNILSVGLGLNVDRREFREGDLRFPNQWDGDKYNPNRPTKEPYVGLNFLFVDLSGGVNYRYQKNNRTWINLGVGVHHFIQPKQTFYDFKNPSGLPIRFSGMLSGSFKVIPTMDILLNGLWQVQQVYDEKVLSGLLRFYLNLRPGSQMALDLGVAWRKGDAFAPLMGIHYHNWYAGLSYDVNTSAFKVATGGRGGPEFHLQYYFYRVEPLKEFKKCPVY